LRGLRFEGLQFGGLRLGSHGKLKLIFNVSILSKSLNDPAS
jgi:hypothetical protein